MRSSITEFFLGSILLSYLAIALPSPQVADNVDPSVNSDSTSADPKVADTYPYAGQGTDLGDDSATTTSLTPVATTAKESHASGLYSAQRAGDSESVMATPLMLDTSSENPPAPLKNSAGGNVTHLRVPGELTGQLLGMPNCSGVLYDPKWDSCDEATGKLTSKIATNGKRQISVFKPHRPSLFARNSKSKRQASEKPNDYSEHERDPTILSGVAGVDDGSTPRKTSVPRAGRGNTRRVVSNWNVPFGESDNSGVSASSSSGDSNSRMAARQTGIVPPYISPFPADLSSHEAQEKTPGNTNFWNTPFQLPQEQGNGQSQGGGKMRRQNSATNLQLQSGPLSGEDRDLDGAIPYMQVGVPKAKRQWEESPHVEVGPPGPGGARNIIINKRQNQTAPIGSTASGDNKNDPTGYLGAIGRSGSGLNFEDPSKDPATIPRRPGPLGKRAQPDFSYVRPAHNGANTGSRGASIPRVVVVNRRQANNSSSSDALANSNGQGGFLGELGAAEVTAAGAGADIIPSHPNKREDEV